MNGFGIQKDIEEYKNNNTCYKCDWNICDVWWCSLNCGQDQTSNECWNCHQKDSDQ